MATLHVHIEGLRNSLGCVRVAAWQHARGWPHKAQGAVGLYVLPIHGGQAEATLTDLAAGTYALAVYHDENNNGRLDTNLFGIPKEGIGFSNNPKIRFGAPSFEDCRLEVRPGPGSTESRVRLRYFLR